MEINALNLIVKELLATKLYISLQSDALFHLLNNMFNEPGSSERRVFVTPEECTKFSPSLIRTEQET